MKKFRRHSVTKGTAMPLRSAGSYRGAARTFIAHGTAVGATPALEAALSDPDTRNAANKPRLLPFRSVVGYSPQSSALEKHFTHSASISAAESKFLRLLKIPRPR